MKHLFKLLILLPWFYFSTGLKMLIEIVNFSQFLLFLLGLHPPLFSF